MEHTSSATNSQNTSSTANSGNTKSTVFNSDASLSTTTNRMRSTTTAISRTATTPTIKPVLSTIAIDKDPVFKLDEKSLRKSPLRMAKKKLYQKLKDEGRRVDMESNMHETKVLNKGYGEKKRREKLAITTASPVIDKEEPMLQVSEEILDQQQPSQKSKKRMYHHLKGQESKGRGVDMESKMHQGKNNNNDYWEKRKMKQSAMATTPSVINKEDSMVPDTNTASPEIDNEEPMLQVSEEILEQQQPLRKSKKRMYHHLKGQESKGRGVNMESRMHEAKSNNNDYWKKRKMEQSATATTPTVINKEDLKGQESKGVDMESRMHESEGNNNNNNDWTTTPAIIDEEDSISEELMEKMPHSRMSSKVGKDLLERLNERRAKMRQDFEERLKLKRGEGDKLRMGGKITGSKHNFFHTGDSSKSRETSIDTAFSGAIRPPPGIRVANPKDFDAGFDDFNRRGKTGRGFEQREQFHSEMENRMMTGMNRNYNHNSGYSDRGTYQRRHPKELMREKSRSVSRSGAGSNFVIPNRRSFESTSLNCRPKDKSAILALLSLAAFKKIKNPHIRESLAEILNLTSSQHSDSIEKILWDKSEFGEGSLRTLHRELQSECSEFADRPLCKFDERSFWRNRGKILRKACGENLNKACDAEDKSAEFLFRNFDPHLDLSLIDCNPSKETCRRLGDSSCEIPCKPVMCLIDDPGDLRRYLTRRSISGTCKWDKLPLWYRLDDSRDECDQSVKFKPTKTSCDGARTYCVQAGSHLVVKMCPYIGEVLKNTF